MSGQNMSNLAAVSERGFARGRIEAERAAPTTAGNESQYDTPVPAEAGYWRTVQRGQADAQKAEYYGVHMTPAEMRLVRELDAQRGRFVLRQHLQFAAFGYVDASSLRQLRVIICRARKLLAGVATIETRRTVGYRLVMAAQEPCGRCGGRGFVEVECMKPVVAPVPPKEIVSAAIHALRESIATHPDWIAAQHAAALGISRERVRQLRIQHSLPIPNAYRTTHLPSRRGRRDQ